jgi:DNA-binding MarR family transcriptional regulator
MTPEKSSAGEGRYSYDGLDRVIHEKARLGILTSLLSRPEGIVFNDLKSLCSLTDGNLSRHLSMLEEAGLISIWKGNQGNRPQTLIRITDVGRAKFQEYLLELERVIRDALPQAQPQTKSGDAFRPGYL